MKLQRLLLSLLVTGALAEISTQDDYEDLCAEKDGTQDEIIPGYKVEYTCGLRGPHTPPRVADVTSAQQCTGDVEPKEQQWYLYMKNVTPPPPPSVEETNQAVISRCDQLRDQCISGFSGLKCEGDGSGNDNDNGNSHGGGGQDNGEGVVATGGSSTHRCSGFNDRAILTSHGQQYKLYCNKFDGPSTYLPGWAGKTVESPSECIKACADYPDKK